MQRTIIVQCLMQLLETFKAYRSTLLYFIRLMHALQSSYLAMRTTSVPEVIQAFAPIPLIRSVGYYFLKT